MLRPNELTRDALEAVVDRLQRALYHDSDADDQAIWNPEKAWNGGDVCDEMAGLLAEYGLVPDDGAALKSSV